MAGTKSVDVEDMGARATFAETYSVAATAMFNKRTAKNQNPDDAGSLTITTATFNLANNVIGAGLVGLSFVLVSSGFWPFVIFITLASLGAIKTLDMLTAAGVYAGRKDFEYVGTAAVGPSGQWITSACVAAQCYGACIAYLVLIASTAPVVGVMLGQEFDPVTLQVIITVVVVLPLCCLKSLTALAPSAIFALIVYLAVALTTIMGVLTDDWYDKVGKVEMDGKTYPACPILEQAGGLANIMSKFPTIMFAFVCHTAALPVFGELQDGQHSSMRVVDKASIGVSYALYVSVGIFGWLTYGGHTFGSVLLNMRHCVYKDCEKRVDIVCADDNTWSSILNVCFLLAVITGYPSVHFALRKSLVTSIWGADTPFSWSVHLGIAFGNVFLTLLIAIIAGGNVSIVFNWAGSLSSPMVSFVLPGLFFILLHRKYLAAIVDRSPVDPSLGPKQGLSAVVFGVMMMILGVGLQIAAMVSS